MRHGTRGLLRWIGTKLRELLDLEETVPDARNGQPSDRLPSSASPDTRSSHGRATRVTDTEPRPPSHISTPYLSDTPGSWGVPREKLCMRRVTARLLLDNKRYTRAWLECGHDVVIFGSTVP